MTKPVAIAVALASIALAAGKKSEPAANSDSFFSSDSNLVLIDSVVTDKKGAYIGDLTAKDFKVKEDGKEQAITSFSYLADGAPGDQKRYVVLLFDNSTVPQIDQHYARDAAMQFIGSNTAPNRMMAVVEFDGGLRVTQNLTGDVDRLKQAVNGVKPSVASAGTFGPVARMTTPKGLPEAVSNLARGLAKVPGRKTVVLFSEGLSGSPDIMKRAIDECNRDDVAVYPIDIAALSRRAEGSGGAALGDASQGRSFGPYGAYQQAVDRQVAVANRQGGGADLSAQRPPSDALYGLAKGTGGFVISGAAELAKDLNRIGKEESQYYALGYVPARESQPGVCHTIKVETDRGGAKVRARTEYCDTDTPVIQPGTSTERDLETRLNGNATSTMRATMQTPFFYVAPNTARVDLALDVPGAAIKFTRDKGKFAGALNVIGIAYLPDGGVAARFNDTAKVVLDDKQQVDEFTSRPYRFEKQFEMAAGKFDLKVAFSSGAVSFGTVETQLTIDPWDPSKFLLSGLAISQTTQPAPAAGLGNVDLFGDSVPLVVNGVQIVPAGTNRLVKSEKAFIYGEIYEPAQGLGLQLTLLNAKGEIVRQTGFMGVKPETLPGTLPGTSAVPFGLTLPIDDLAPGLYTAQIAAQDVAGNHAVRRIDFELAP